MHEFDKKVDAETINEDHKKPKLKKYSKSDVICDTNHSFYKYYDIKKFDNLSLKVFFSSQLFLMIYIHSVG